MAKKSPIVIEVVIRKSRNHKGQWVVEMVATNRGQVGTRWPASLFKTKQAAREAAIREGAIQARDFNADLSIMEK